MRRGLHPIVLFWAFMTIAWHAPDALSDEIVMTPPPPVDFATPQIVGGKPLDRAEWPASFGFNPLNKPDGWCSSTAIGPRVILTAGHCVTNGQTGTLNLAEFKSEFKCSWHTKFDGKDDNDFDVALCLTDKEIHLKEWKPGTILAFERINTDPSFPHVGDQVMLQGYGCTKAYGLGKGGALYGGNAYIGSEFVLDVLTFHMANNSATSICSGDSGGASFKTSNIRRAIIGVNEAGNNLDSSKLVNVANPEILDFMRKWRPKGVVICGLDDAAEPCHD